MVSRRWTFLSLCFSLWMSLVFLCESFQPKTPYFRKVRVNNSCAVTTENFLLQRKINCPFDLSASFSNSRSVLGPLLLSNLDQNQKGDNANKDPSTKSIRTSDESEENGSIAGASLLFAGTAIGAGMLALPAETVDAGFVPSVVSLVLCWVFTYVTAMVTLESSWLTVMKASNNADGNNDDVGGGFLSISRMTLGVPGEIITAALFWFLLTSIIVAYTAEGGQLISQFFEEIAHASAVVPALGSVIFAAFFSALAIFGTSRVDTVNRIFVFGLVATFIGLVGIGLPMAKVSNLIDHSDWNAVYPAGISIGILSFGAQNVVPTLLRYLNNDPVRTRQAILLGSLLPLLLYTIWEAVFLGVIDFSDTGADESKMEVVNVFGKIGGSTVKSLVEAFSICAIGSSMAGASVSLVDFFQDAFDAFEKKKTFEEKKTLPSFNSLLQGESSRLVAAAFALGPPVILAYAFPDIFLVALEEAGLLGGVSLYGLIPALSVIVLRQSAFESIADEKEMPGRLGGGNISLLCLVAVSSALIIPEILRLGSLAFDSSSI